MRTVDDLVHEGIVRALRGTPIRGILQNRDELDNLQAQIVREIKGEGVLIPEGLALEMADIFIELAELSAKSGHKYEARGDLTRANQFLAAAGLPPHTIEGVKPLW